jgi:replication factor A1
MKRLMVSEEEIQAKMKELDKEMGGYLNPDTLRRFALSSLGIKTPKTIQEAGAPMKKLADIKDREEVTVEVTVLKIPTPRSFKKKDGSQGRVLNINVRDETGSCRLALWDDDVELVTSLPIEEGSRLLCEQFFVKISEYGIDLSLGRSGKLKKL